MTKEQVTEFAKKHGYDKVDYLGNSEGKDFYVPYIDFGDSEMIPPTGLPSVIAISDEDAEIIHAPESLDILEKFS